MSHSFEAITDEQWRSLENLFPQEVKRKRGKPHAPWRGIVNSILFILLTGNKWGALPIGFPFVTKSVAHRWFIIWGKSGLLQELLNRFTSVIKIDQAQIKLPRRRHRNPKPKIGESAEARAAI